MKLLFHPDAEREFHEGVRQYLLIDPALALDDVFYITAVMHLHAKPGYWRKRLKDSPVKTRRTNRRKR